MIRKVILALVVLLWSTHAYAQYPVLHTPKPNCHAIKAKGDQPGCLACAVFYESKSEPLEGRLAVALVTINRTLSKEFPNTICSAVWQTKPSRQYDWTARASLVPDNRDQWEEALRVAHAVHELSQRSDYRSWDFTQNSMFFHAKSIRPGWRYPRIGENGQHVFYGLPNEVTKPRCLKILDTRVGDCK